MCHSPQTGSGTARGLPLAGQMTCYRHFVFVPGKLGLCCYIEAIRDAHWRARPIPQSRTRLPTRSRERPSRRGLNSVRAVYREGRTS
jgi:hypothetical protein